MPNFGKVCLFQSRRVDKTLPRDFDGNLECYIFLKTVMCKNSKEF